MERVVDVSGVPVLLCAEDRRRARALERLLSGSPPSRSSPEVSIHYRADGPKLPDRAPDVNDSQIRLWFDGMELVAQSRLGLTASVSGGEVWVGGATLDIVAGLDNMFLCLLTHALFPRGLYALHAGAIALGGRAVLVLGASGMGKSTVAFTALESGWSVLSDDIVVLRPGDQDELEVAGLAQPMAVPGELLESLEASERETLLGKPLPGDARARSLVAEFTPEPGWWPVAGSLIVAHGDQPLGRLTRIGSPVALGALLQSFAGAINPSLLPGFFTVAAEVARRPGHRLAQGRDPSQRLLATRELLRELGDLAVRSTQAA